MRECKIALVGNPNTGKSSLFNQLTGLNQRVGNYPGITTDKKTGTFTHGGITYRLYDLPGTYSLYPGSKDEEVVFEVLADTAHRDRPDKIVVVGDPVNLKRSLLLFRQVQQLGIPVMLAINRIDEAGRRGIEIRKNELADFAGTTVVFTNARKGTGIAELKNGIRDLKEIPPASFTVPAEYTEAVHAVQRTPGVANIYKAWQLLARKEVHHLKAEEAAALAKLRLEFHIVPRRLQVKETLDWYRQIEPQMGRIVTQTPGYRSFSERFDKVLLHPFFGYLIFFGLLFLIFQAIFSWSALPMVWIESGFGRLSAFLKDAIPSGPATDLLADGIVPGIGGIAVFVPQIVILFFFLLLMEETGYMSRVVFLMDKWMRPFGLNGKSMVPLMSGAACAVPAVMSARNIENSKERIITILVTPFMTCSARLPVYALITALVIPDISFLGLSLKAITLMGLYLLGLAAALASAWIYHRFIKSRYKSYLIMEVPAYKWPHWKNVFVSLWEKTSAFIFGAGKIILAVSIVLWVLASFGPGREFAMADEIVRSRPENIGLAENELSAKVSAHRMENSYLGHVGKVIEPVIRPLGYDWKIGIGILASFAAREVFVPTMATIYSISYDDSDNQKDLRLSDRMRNEVHPRTGKPLYSLATGISLLLFYAFAMQCMSTLAAVKRETKRWKWPAMQLVSMTGLAYITALIAYQALK